MSKPVDVTITTERLAVVMGLDLATFNAGCYAGTNFPLRRMTGAEVVRVVGFTNGARVVSDETWIVDRFGSLGARQVKRLLEK